MTVCKYFMQGNCHFGTKCWYEHPSPSGANGNAQRNLNFSNFGQNNSSQSAGGFQSNARQGQPQQNKYKWTAPQVAFGGNNNSTSAQQQQQSMSPQEIISGLSREITTWESSKMWLLSCVSFQKSGPSIPGMTDMSPEELRFEAYEAQKNENFQDYIHKVQQMHNDYSAKRQELKAPSAQLRDKLIEFIETSRKQEALAAANSSSRFSGSSASAFGSSNALGQGGGFGGDSSKVFANTSTNLFGKSEPAANPFTGQNNAFGGTPTGSAFGHSSPAQSSGTSVFGNSGGGGGGSNAAFGGQMGSCISSVFGNTTNQGITPQPLNQMASTGNVFGNQGLTNTPQGNAFGGSTSVFGTPPITTGTSPATGLFGKPAAPATGFAQQSVFGSGMSASGGSSVFGAAPAAGGSVFGQPTPSASEITPTMYTPLENLTPAELEQYQAQKFTLGKIPTRPPPYELCF